MTATTEELLPAIAPELFADPEQAALRAGARELVMAEAERQIGEGVFGESRPYAVALLTAHMITLGNRGGNAGAVSSLKEGGLAVSYAQASTTEEALGLTSYGAELIRLRRSKLIGARTALCPS